MKRIRKNDLVEVIRGDSAGPTPRRVIQVLDGGQRLVVEGVNRVFKHVRKGHPKSPAGGRLQFERPINSSNVLLYCESCGKGVRVGARYTEDGSKERFCRSCGRAMGQLSPPRAHYAKK
jgi:large subunit ribosomal protein L24